VKIGREIELAASHKLPKIVEYDEVLGDLQMHTTYSDGAHTVEEMAREAQRLGRKYIAVTDHVGHLKIAGAMDVRTIEKQWREIEKVDRKMKGIKILKGCEVDINPDGTLALEDKYLAKFDVVLGSIHSNFKMSRADQTKRLIRAMENPRVDIISHPTGRVIHQRAGYDLDLEAVFQAAARTKNDFGDKRLSGSLGFERLEHPAGDRARCEIIHRHRLAQQNPVALFGFRRCPGSAGLGREKRYCELFSS
jgi:DNA polymerase (family 10)